MRAEFNFGRRVGGRSGIVTTRSNVVGSRHQNHVTKVVVRAEPEIWRNLLKNQYAFYKVQFISAFYIKGYFHLPEWQIFAINKLESFS